jgi:hypothetical protein
MMGLPPLGFWFALVAGGKAGHTNGDRFRGSD